MDIVTIREKVTQYVKKYRYALLVVLLGIGLMLIPSRKEVVSEDTQPTQVQVQTQTNVAEQLEQILSQIQGAGKVQVMLTVEAGEKTVYQVDQDISNAENGTQRFETVIVTDSERNESGLIQQVNPESYRGAIIVCSGADNASVRLAIVEAVSKVTGLGADRISVLKMK